MAASPAHTCGQEERGQKQNQGLGKGLPQPLPTPEPHSCEYSSLSSDLRSPGIHPEARGCRACRQGGSASREPVPSGGQCKQELRLRNERCSWQLSSCSSVISGKAKVKVKLKWAVVLPPACPAQPGLADFWQPRAALAGRETPGPVSLWESR